jgi:hypothetical protein
MSSNHSIGMARRHRRTVMHVAVSAVIAALVVVGEGTTGTGFTQDKSGPSAGPSPSASPSDREKAPIGHRQPRVQDLPPDLRAGEGARTTGEKALDDALKSICRGC